MDDSILSSCHSKMLPDWAILIKLNLLQLKNRPAARDCHTLKVIQEMQSAGNLGKVPWSLVISMKHILREGNKTADELEKSDSRVKREE